MLIFADYRRRLARGGPGNPAAPAGVMSAICKDWIAPARTALLLIDMQVDFARPQGAMARQGIDMTAAQAAVRQAALLADAARAAGVPCVFVRLVTRPGDETAFVHANGKRGAKAIGTAALPRRQRGRGLCRAQAASRRSWSFPKRATTPLPAPGLDAQLRAWGIDTLVMAGLTTECCIDSSARDAFERDYHVFIAERRRAPPMSPICTRHALQGPGTQLRHAGADRRYSSRPGKSNVNQRLTVTDRASVRAWHVAVKC